MTEDQRPSDPQPFNDDSDEGAEARQLQGEVNQSPWQVALTGFNRAKTQPYDRSAVADAFGALNSALSERGDIGRFERLALGRDLAQQAATFAESNNDQDSTEAYNQVAAAYHQLQHEYGYYTD